MESNDQSQARKRKIPDRFGNTGDISSDESEPFGDNSFEDRNYEPQAKKSTVHEHNKSAVASTNFDEFFDQIGVDKSTVEDILLEQSVEKERSVEIEPEKEDNSSRKDINNNENSQTELLRQLIVKLHEKIFGDSWFLSRSNDIVKISHIIQKDGGFEIYGFKVIHKEPFFNEPLNSTKFHIFCSDGQLGKDLSRFDLKNIFAKLWCLSSKNRFVYMPILHSIDELNKN